MSKHRRNNKLFESSLVRRALQQSFVKLNPAVMMKNPVMFTVYIGTLIMLGVCFWISSGEKNQGTLLYNFVIFAVLLITLLFANFAEAIAEARGKAQADSLRKTRGRYARKKLEAIGEVFMNEIVVSSSQLKKGDRFCL
jgi:K+-transporting ATPase ATPase B chain